MKYVSIMSWRSENAEKVTEHFKKWKVPEGEKWIAGPYTMDRTSPYLYWSVLMRHGFRWIDIGVLSVLGSLMLLWSQLK